MRNVFLGFLAGALAACGLAGLLRATPRGAREATHPEATRAPADIPAAEVEELQRKLATLRTENTSLRASLAASRASADPAARPAAKKEALPATGSGWGQTMRDGQAAEIARLGRLAEKMRALGLRLDEVTAGPDGRWADILAYLAQSDAPPDPGQQKAIEEISAARGKEWDAYLARRAGLSGMEQALELDRIDADSKKALWSTLSEAQREDVFGGGAGWWDCPTGRPRDVPAGGSREDVEQTLTDAWVQDLGLDYDTKSPAVRVAVREYMKEMQAAEAAVGDLEPWEDHWPARWEIECAAKAQKRLEETLGLEGEQAKALRAWSSVDEFQVREEAK